MAEVTQGATYADAIIAALSFAREAPGTFLLTVPVTIALTTVFTIVWFKVVLANPIAKQQEKFEAERKKNRIEKEPKLPL